MIELIIRFLRLLHYLIILFVVFGGLIPNSAILLFHLLFIPSMILHWRMTDGVCFLTHIEHKLKGTSIESKVELRGGFIKSILSRFFDPLPSDSSIKKGLYTVLMLSLLLSLGHLLYRVLLR